MTAVVPSQAEWLSGIAGALQVAGAHAKDRLRNMQINGMNYEYEHVIDKPEIDQWTWPG